MKPFDRFLDLVEARHGNPAAVFAGKESIKRGTPIRVYVEDKERSGLPGLLEAIGMFKKNKRGDHLVRVIGRHGRKWDFYAPASDILIQW